MTKFVLALFFILTSIPALATNATCKSSSGLWFVYCGGVKAADNGYGDSASCFRSAKETCPADESKTSATCKKGKGDLYYVYCQGEQVGDGGYGTTESCFAQAKYACP